MRGVGVGIESAAAGAPSLSCAIQTSVQWQALQVPAVPHHPRASGAARPRGDTVPRTQLTLLPWRSKLSPSSSMTIRHAHAICTCTCTLTLLLHTKPEPLSVAWGRGLLGHLRSRALHNKDAPGAWRKPRPPGTWQGTPWSKRRPGETPSAQIFCTHTRHWVLLLCVWGGVGKGEGEGGEGLLHVAYKERTSAT